MKFHVANAIAKLGLDDRRALRRWRGAPKDSALIATEERNRRRDDDDASKRELGPIGQISRTVQDIEQPTPGTAACSGLRHLYTFGKLAFFDCGGTRLFLSAENGASAAGVDPVFPRRRHRGEHAELAARGVEFKGAPHMIHRHADGTEEWMAFFKDLEGRPLALMSQVKPLE